MRDKKEIKNGVHKRKSRKSKKAQERGKQEKETTTNCSTIKMI